MTRTGKIVVTGVNAALLLGVLAGCGAPKEAPSAQETEKAVQVEKQTAGGESLFVIEDNAAARAFVEDFLNEDTYLGDGAYSVGTEAVANLTPECVYVVYQQDTVLAGQTARAGYTEMLRDTLYQDSNVLTLSVTASGEIRNVQESTGLEELLGENWLEDLVTGSYEIPAQRADFLKTYIPEAAQ